MSVGSFAAAREQGLLRLEGKDYIRQRVDLLYFQSNV
jgi:ribosome-binding ATPase YchF (GTP1/OBG family)